MLDAASLAVWAVTVWAPLTDVGDFGFIALSSVLPKMTKALENAPAAEATASATESADANVAATSGGSPLRFRWLMRARAHDVEKRRTRWLGN